MAEDLRTQTELEQLYELKAKKLILLKDQAKLKIGLPHLHKHKHYSWSRDFLNSKNRMCFLTAANQVGKSTIQIKKVLHLATEPGVWKHYFKQDPRVFWYIYPSTEMISIEWESKWKPLMPQGPYEKNPQYGWELIKRQNKIFAIKFNTGITLFFRTYSQDANDLQGTSLDYLALDEEPPVELMDELLFRLTATEGLMSCVFTATRGQQFFKQVMEPEENETELLPEAAKWRVSLYDCLKYEDGSKSHWTIDKINDIIARCTSHSEVLRRVGGRFVPSTEGKMYPSFQFNKHYNLEPGIIPKNGSFYAGVDIGSGGGKGHPAAIVILSVEQDFKKARIIQCWRGDKEVTTVQDIVNQYLVMSKSLNINSVFYDWASADFYTVASRLGLPVVKAEKSHKIGVQILNTLFRSGMLSIDASEEAAKLSFELSNVKSDGSKNKKNDDLADAARYAVSQIPWDWSALGITLADLEAPILEDSLPRPPEKKLKHRWDLKEAEEMREQMEQVESIEDEIAHWNEAYGN